jgi:hypothetical protein
MQWELSGRAAQQESSYSLLRGQCRGFVTAPLSPGVCDFYHPCTASSAQLSDDMDSFSSCSVESFNAFAAGESPFGGFYDGIECLSASPPSNTYEDGVCGDGLVSGDEECDAGSEASPCCDEVSHRRCCVAVVVVLAAAVADAVDVVAGIFVVVVGVVACCHTSTDGYREPNTA